MADGEVLGGTKDFAYIMTERFQVERKALPTKQRKRGCEKTKCAFSQPFVVKYINIIAVGRL